MTALILSKMIAENIPKVTKALKKPTRISLSLFITLVRNLYFFFFGCQTGFLQHSCLMLRVETELVFPVPMHLYICVES